ncbi:GCN5-like N-acetyltransferase [Mycolicibacter terrae]|uniref:GCN5-like N-acetyltransferase n=1 Tax=Mycolicibacter terrae TaxID=1788 RepID=A0AAD1I0N9_9MYCO|nr:GNAT family N-acetyltransferase [Mycolicibacter terrae]ORW93646.1 GCN5 family acetyltransferase [Mycolicibacter terrae]BBX24225.1 GCN5-like N-acetyltransferase [Mycolicibacter terrae]SNV55186.1 N-acetyltransferase GCN5 [Mycolicibacter terrae]
MSRRPELPPELPEVGARVSLRYLRPPGSEPPMGDVVGHLVQTGPLVRVRSSDGVIHDCRHADVLYVRRLTDRPVKNSAIRSVEHAAALAWPGSEHQWLDGWMMRAGPGAGLEANSAVPLDMFAHTNTLPAIIAWYAQRDLPPCLAVPERLLRLPEDIPARYETRTLVRELPAGEPGGDVLLAGEPDADWLASGGAEPVDVLTAVVGGEVVFASIPGVGVGRAALTEAPDGTRWLGLSALRVAAERRRQGHGRTICAALQAWGFDRGATRGYAQVPGGSPDGAIAFGFFEAIGFAGQHRTRYLDARLL